MVTRNILITGAGGFIGSHLAKNLFEEGNFVRGVDIKWDDYFEEEYCSERMALDIRNPEACREALDGIDHVYHLAADMGGIGYITKIGADIMQNSALMNINLLQGSVEGQVSRFFYSSSACVYPEFKQMEEKIPPLKEEDAIPAEPDTFYGWEKLFTEKLCEAYTEDYGLETRVARFHNIYGPYGTYDGGKEKAPAALCRKVVTTSDPGEMVIWGDGKQTRSFLYIDDCVRGVKTLMESDYREPVNIGSDRLVTIDELADIIIDTSGKDISKVHDTSKPQGVRGRNADLTLVKREIGWEPEVTLEEGLKRTYRWIAGQLKDQSKI